MILEILAGFLLVSLIFTYILKHFNIGETHVIITLLRSKKAVKFFDLFTKPKRLLELIADFGLIIGFGAIGVDYLFGRKLSLVKRIALFFVAAIFFTAFFFFILSPFFKNPLIENDYSMLFSFFFGIAGFSGLILVTLIVSGIEIIFRTLSGEKTCPAVAPVIPGVEIPNVPITVPLHGWISLLLILIIHEGSHGILMRKVKLTVKSTGIILLGFLPIGAFVEPEDKELKKLNKLDAVRIFTSGATANFLAFIVFGFLSLLAIVFLVNPFLVPTFDSLNRMSIQGIQIGEMQEFSELCGVKYSNSAFGKLLPGMKLLEVEGQKIQIFSDFIKHSQGKKEVKVKLKSLDGKIVEETLSRNKLNLFGFTVKPIPNPDFEMPFHFTVIGIVFSFLASFILWFVLLNLMVSLVNFLPTEPFDGGKIAKIVFTEYLGFTGWSQEFKEKIISRFFGIGTLILLLINIMPLFL